DALPIFGVAGRDAGDLVPGAVPRLRGRFLVFGVGLDPRASGDQQLVGRHDLVDQADLERLGRLVALALQQDVHQRILDAEHARRAGDAAAAGQQAQRDLGEADLVATLRRDAVVA